MGRIYYYIAIGVLCVGAAGITVWQFALLRLEPMQAGSSSGTAPSTAPSTAMTDGNPLLTIDKERLRLIMQQCGAELFMVEHPSAATRRSCANAIHRRAKEQLGVSLSANEIDNAQVKARWLRLLDVTDAERRLVNRASKGGQ